MPLIDTMARAAIAASSTVLPVSESAHRSLATLWLGRAAEPAAVRVAAALGAAVGLALVLRERGLPCLRALGALPRSGAASFRSDGGRDLAVVSIAALVSVGIELALRGRALTLAEEPLVVGVGLAATVVLLLSTAAAPPPRQLRPGWLGALLVGVAHGLGVVPGASQVGGAFVALSWLGVRGWRAAELALLVSVPTLLGSAALGIGDVTTAPRLDLGIGVAVAALAASAAAFGWRLLADRERTRLLVTWLAPLALAFLGYAYAIAR